MTKAPFRKKDGILAGLPSFNIALHESTGEYHIRVLNSHFAGRLTTAEVATLLSKIEPGRLEEKATGWTSRTFWPHSKEHRRLAPTVLRLIQNAKSELLTH